jgi:hypothetical protein
MGASATYPGFSPLTLRATGLTDKRRIVARSRVSLLSALGRMPAPAISVNQKHRENYDPTQYMCEGDEIPDAEDRIAGRPG